VLMLGSVSPWAIRLKLRGVEDSGELAGRMYAISTVGSLLGTFAAALLLIPLIGTQRTFLTFALITAAVAALGLRVHWALVPLAIAGLLAVPVGTVKDSGEGRVIHEADTEYQYARVVEKEDGVRVLELNEGQAEHSLCRAECDAGRAGPRDPRSVLTGDYWDGHLVLGFLAAEPEPRRVAILGNAAGTVSRGFERFFPRTRVDGVEIDHELSEIGRRYFDMNNPRLHLYHEDARPFLRRVDARYDQISLDTYRQPYIPFYLTTVEFFESVRDHLRPGGALIVNVGHPEGEDELEKVLTATIGEVFPHVARDPIQATNTLIVASRAPLSVDRLRRAAGRLPPVLRATALHAAADVEAPLGGGAVYTDDKAPVEWLIDKSILDYAGDHR